MSLRKPRTIGQCLLLVSPAFVIIASVAIGFLAEHFNPHRGATALLATLFGMVPALILSISTGCWLLRVDPRDDFGRAVQGGLLGLGLFAVNFILALPACIVVGNLMRKPPTPAAISSFSSDRFDV